jgi:hypothetical protein
MALWQIVDRGKGKKKLDEQWDDGDKFVPGEEGFDTKKIKAYAGEGNFNYIGTPNWTSPE